MKKRSILVLLLAAAASVAVASDDEATLTPSEAVPPETLSEAVRAAVDQKAQEVSINGTPTASLWFRTELPVQADAVGDLGVTFGGLAESVFVGAVSLATSWKDYKGNPVAPGVYTMRYVIQPADGNHMGVSLYRDFLALIPAAMDQDPEAEFDHEALVTMSTNASKLTHPAVLALFPVWEPVGQPAMMKNDMDQWMLATPFGSLNVGLTMTGQGEH